MGEREKQYSGTISYRKLFELMDKKNIKKMVQQQDCKSVEIFLKVYSESKKAVEQ